MSHEERRQVVLDNLTEHGWKIVENTPEVVRLRLPTDTDRELRVAPRGAMTYAEQTEGGEWKTHPCRLTKPAWETGVHETLEAVYKWDTKKNEARRLAAFNRELERGTDEHWTLADDLPKNY